MKRLLLILGLLVCAANASAQTTTFNGVVKDLTSTPVPTGQVTFQLKPGIDTTISGSSRFVPATTFCEIHNPSVVSTSGTGTITVVVNTAQNWQVGDSLIFVGTADATLNASSVASPYTITLVNSSTSFNFTQSGTHTNGTGGTVGGLYKSGGTGACAVMQNSAITPANTSYTVSISAVFSPSSSFNTYAIGSGPVDISTVVPTPSQQPSYSFMDLFSTQTVTGNKTATGTWSFNGLVNLGSVSGTPSFTSINNVVYADTQVGATADVKIANCIAALPAGGGTCDARGLVGAQTWAANPFAGNKANVTVLFSPSATFTASNTTTIGAPNVWLFLNGATIDFEPTCPCSAFVNDRAVAFQGGFVTSPGGRTNRPTTGTIALKATSFVATNANDVSDVVAGDWLQVYQTDPGVGDAVAADWVQVLSVSGTTINIVGVFRTAFVDNTTDSILFNRLATPIVENGGIVGGTVKNTNAATSMPGIEAGISRNITIRDNVVQIPSGQPLYAYQSSQAKFTQNRVKATGSNAVGSEFAKSNDITIEDNNFQAETSTSAANILLDFGLGHFKFTNNTVNAGATSIAVLMQTGAHDGAVKGNIVSMIPGQAGAGTSIIGQGARNVIISGNRLEASAAAASVGVNLNNSSSLTLAINSGGNVVADNKATSFTTDYTTVGATDLIVKDDGSGNFVINHTLSVGGGTALATTNQSGTGSLCMTTSCAMTTPALTTPALTTPTIGGGSTINKVLLGSGTLTFTPISANTCQEQPLTVTGAATTGISQANPTTNLGNTNLSWSSWISATNTVTVRVCNPSTGSITPTAVTWNASVIQ